MGAWGVPIYTSGSQSADAAHGMKVTSDGADQTGPRLVFQGYADWVLIPGAGNIDNAGGQQPGIYTTGQMNCMAVIAASFGASSWSACLAHVSHKRHSKLDEIDTFLLKNADACVAIGGKPGVLSAMREIAARFAKAQRVWVYVGGDGSPDFGMNREGYFGETAQ